MQCTKCSYLGLELKNPLIASSCPLTGTVAQARKLEAAGVGGIVVRSIFEEQIREEIAGMYDSLTESGSGAALDYLRADLPMQLGPEKYIANLRALRQELKIPVIASINCIAPDQWVTFARKLEQAGADALELNIYHVAADTGASGEAVEARYVSLLTELRGAVNIPIIMKLSPFFSSLPHFVKQLEHAGARGIALFNRFYQPDFDLDTLRMVDQLHLSYPDEVLLRMRWIAILHGRTSLTLAATGGVHACQEAIKLLLAGADVVHLASCLLQHGPERLAEILANLERWMGEREYTSVAQLKGSMSQKKLPDPGAVERASYLRVLDSYAPAAGVWR